MQTDTKTVPLELLLGNPEKASPQISPDGKRLAFLAPDEGVLNIWVQTLGADDARPITKDRHRGIGGFFWAGAQQFFWAHDNRHVLYVQDRDGDENWHLFAADAETAEVRDLTPMEGIQTQIIALDKKRPDEILLAINKDNPALHDAWRLNIATGELVKDTTNPGFLSGIRAAWLVDSDFRVRGGTRQRPDGGIEILVRNSEEDDFEVVLSLGPDDQMSSAAVGFTPDGTGLYLISSQDRDTARLVAFDIASRTVTAELASDPDYDVSDVLLNPDTHEVQLAEIVKDRSTHVVVDESIAADVAAIAKLDAGDFSIVDRDHADRRWVVSFMNDDRPLTYFLYDRETKTGEKLFSTQPALEAYPLAKMEPFSLRSRDGLMLHGYLSFPPDAPRENLPTVLFPHGGPWGRDIWMFFPWVQAIATRGYLVVQVDFRGSTGYGKAFVNAGNKEWGAKMHDDLLDTVDWVVEQGYADKDRVGIFGASYGGYAALVAATFTPEVFRCAVDMVGPSSLITLLESIPPYWEPMKAMWYSRMGSLETERDMLWERSPLSKVDKITIPLLVAQGGQDPRVKQAESEQIVAAMKERNLPVEYLLFPDEGHGFVKPESNLTFFRAMLDFFAEHLA